MTLNYPNLKSKPPTLQYLKTHLFENIPEVSSTITTSPNNDLDTFMVYNLPFKHNRGKPPNWYSSNFLEKRSKIPNYKLCIYLEVIKMS